MGFPAVGVEGIYRNHRADVQRFLSTRHGSDFWVFNFCPVRENAYHDNVFEGRVSRYPFPDHQSVPSVSCKDHAYCFQCSAIPVPPVGHTRNTRMALWLGYPCGCASL
ncbi:hypothetical protein JVT61DRAFT_10248 [Boletus reticuloceps]|uniref:Uncharacterized protein n=1 Tax=Boletus reticuloceps TaxID=495285 RepID=A0A8I2YZY5_9AGAM|nr:hypothetical protein JVT61DRAFT_10248 [Boletus reticuloceps]